MNKFTHSNELTSLFGDIVKILFRFEPNPISNLSVLSENIAIERNCDSYMKVVQF